jgi:myo-inositol 2-dehydrogenase / D-chiro-inositol 1-dehydrogenase
MDTPTTLPFSRREFLTGSGAVVAAAAAAKFPSVARGAWAGGSDTLRIGVIGSGGRGTGAALNALEADPSTQITALADLFADRLAAARDGLAGLEGFGTRATVGDEQCYVGFDAYKQLLESAPVDVVILATSPHYRPIHFEAAIAAGKHVFIEKPVGVDPTGIRRVLAAGEQADAKGLCVVAGTQRRHEAKYLALMERVHAGAAGKLVSACCWWNQGPLWVIEPRPEFTDMEWQNRNWLYFSWTSGDHIVEQHVHNLDVINWAMSSHPVKCVGMGGRQVRVQSEYGNIFDHFAVEYEYPNGAVCTSMCRQIEGCASRVDEMVVGTGGVVRFGEGVIDGPYPYRYAGAPEGDVSPYVQEHIDLYAAIRSGKRVNEARTVAESTLTAIMGRMSAYTGQEVTWEQAMASTLDLSPRAYEFGANPVDGVATPGKTALV